MNDIAGSSSFRRRLLANMPEEAATSFTDLQLAMIEHALDSGRWQIHPLDIRFSIPFFWRQFYFVFLAGPERRSPERRRDERISRPIKAVANSVVFALFLMLLIPAAVGTVQIISMDWTGL